MKIVLLGAPGCGKGTQAQILSKYLGIPHISTGEIFRSAMDAGTELGTLAKTYISQGALVPDTVTTNLVRERLNRKDCEHGYILDGFPRNISQAKALDKMQDIDYCIYFDIDLSVLKDRILNRFTCKDCGAVTNSASTTCPVCGGALYRRADDNEDTLNSRLDTFTRITYPLHDYYKRQGKLITVDAYQTRDDVTKSILSKLGVQE